MEELLKIIDSRRSVRSYKPLMVEIELLDKVLNAGMHAPTGKNLQSPIILAITNKNIRDELSKLLAGIRGVEADPFYGAPVVLVVLAKKDVVTHVYDGSCVLENMLLAAHSLGLGACWIHHAKEMFETNYGKNLLRSLGLEGEYEGVGNCILGYPNITATAPIKIKGNYVYYIN